MGSIPITRSNLSEPARPEHSLGRWNIRKSQAFQSEPSSIPSLSAKPIAHCIDVGLNAEILASSSGRCAAVPKRDWETLAGQRNTTAPFRGICRGFLPPAGQCKRPIQAQFVVNTDIFVSQRQRLDATSKPKPRSVDHIVPLAAGFKTPVTGLGRHACIAFRRGHLPILAALRGLLLLLDRRIAGVHRTATKMARRCIGSQFGGPFFQLRAQFCIG